MRCRCCRPGGGTALAVGGGLAALLVAYRRRLRERVLTWGATPEEVSARMPGDELLEDAAVVSTRAITIDAPASAVWPWLVQMGPGRGGAYTYDWIENLLGLDIHSSDRVLPQFQGLAVGDVVRARDGTPWMHVRILEPDRTLAWRSDDGGWIWTFVLAERDGATRLVSRNRISMRDDALGRRVAMAVMEPGSLVMERKMLRGIAERAERLARSGAPTDPDGA